MDKKNQLQKYLFIYIYICFGCHKVINGVYAVLIYIHIYVLTVCFRFSACTYVSMYLY